MKINKINYVSSVYFFALAFVLYLAMGIIQLVVEKMSPGTFAGFGLSTPSLLISVLYAPIVGGLSGCLFALFAILIYNFVARKYPFSFKLDKK